MFLSLLSHLQNFGYYTHLSASRGSCFWSLGNLQSPVLGEWPTWSTHQILPSVVTSHPLPHMTFQLEKSLSSSTPPEMSAKATALPWRMFCSSGAHLTDCQITGDSMVQLLFLRQLGESHGDVIYLFFSIWFVEHGPKAKQLKSSLEPQHGWPAGVCSQHTRRSQEQSQLQWRASTWQSSVSTRAAGKEDEVKGHLLDVLDSLNYFHAATCKWGCQC